MGKLHKYLLAVFSILLFTSLLILSFPLNYYHSKGLETNSLISNPLNIDKFSTANLHQNSSSTNNINHQNNMHKDSALMFDNDFYPNRTFTLIGKNINLDIAPNKKVLTWTFNGTMPGPTIRISENENITVKFINQSPNPHTIHFHGYHDELNDGVAPMVLPGQTYNYNLTGQPPGVLLYYCDVVPTSQHIKMGMYGALIVDPQNKTNFTSARDFLMIASEFNVKKQDSIVADYYIINGYADQYLHYPINARQNELVRIYIVNAGVNSPISLHFHGTMVKNYPSGLLENSPITSQSVFVGPGDASIVEAKWKYPGNYLFHSHGYQQEHGDRGMIKISPDTSNISANSGKFDNSQIKRQYDLQTRLQKPSIPVYTNYTISKSINQDSFNIDNILNRNPINNTVEISIAMNSALPNNDVFYSPATIKVIKGQEVKWTNDDKFIHTVTSGDASTGGNGEFDSGIIKPNDSFTTVFLNEGNYNYYCVYHPWMFGSIIVK